MQIVLHRILEMSSALLVFAGLEVCKQPGTVDLCIYF